MKTLSKKPMIRLALAGTILMAGSCTYKQEREQLQTQAIQLEQQLHERDSAYNSLMTVMTDVETQIEKIKEQENLISMSAYDMEMNKSDQMVVDLENINELITSTNAMVRDLSKRLDKSNLDLSAFRKKVKQIESDLQERESALVLLRQEVAMKDQKIESLETEVEKLFAEVIGRDTTIAIQLEELGRREVALQKGYFAVDSEKKLREEGVITKEGGFLGLGKSTGLQPDMVQGKFTEVDVLLTTKFYIESDKVEIITEHPTDSYKLVRENERVQYLEVTDPLSFWKISKYLVVSTKS